MLCIITADFLSGLGHWFEQTYLSPGRNKILDEFVTLPNIDHHRNPKAILKGTYWATNRVVIVITLAVSLVLFLLGVDFWQPYFTLALISQFNQVHKWAHGYAPRPVRWLQSIGILQSPSEHHLHHKRPYSTHYCTLTNFLNPVLDKIRFWRILERIVPLEIKRGSPERDGY